jgi:hypothetical protein
MNFSFAEIYCGILMGDKSEEELKHSRPKLWNYADKADFMAKEKINKMQMEGLLGQVR